MTPTISLQHPEMTDREHEHINERLGEIRRLLDNRTTSPDKSNSEIAAALTTLKDYLLGHFEAEEHSPLFREMDGDGMWMRHEIDQLVLQHRLLRDQLGRLTQLANGTQLSSEGWREFADQFAQFHQELLEHENTETELWQVAYNQDVGTKD